MLGTQLTELFVQAGVKLPSEEFYTQSTQLTSGVTYQFYVVAENEVGTSAASEVIAVKAATTPFKITEIEILFQSMYQLSVKWTPAHNGGD